MRRTRIMSFRTIYGNYWFFLWQRLLALFSALSYYSIKESWAIIGQILMNMRLSFWLPFCPLSACSGACLFWQSSRSWNAKVCLWKWIANITNFWKSSILKYAGSGMILRTISKYCPPFCLSEGMNILKIWQRIALSSSLWHTVGMRRSMRCYPLKKVWWSIMGYAWK